MGTQGYRQSVTGVTVAPSHPGHWLCKHSDSAACKKGKVTHIAEGAVEIPGCASQGTKVHTLFRVRLGGLLAKPLYQSSQPSLTWTGASWAH